MWHTSRPIPEEEDYKAPKPPMKKSFKTMIKMVKDSAKYDNRGEPQLSSALLKDLVEYIGQHIINNQQKWKSCS